MAKTELLKIAKPILFNTEMVKAIIEGKKTVTRRVVKNQDIVGEEGHLKSELMTDYMWQRVRKSMPQSFGLKFFASYKVGDILYVRETWAYQFGLYWHKATRYEENMTPPNKWKPSIHMPKSAARIFLKVTDVRVERLQDITAEQIDAEGCKEYGYNAETGKLMPSRPTWFKIIWDNTIKKQDLDKYGWEANPWVWVYEFERVECDEVN